MCNALVGRVASVTGEGGERIAVLMVGDVARSASLLMVPDAAPGDWVVFHSGYALRIVSEDDATRFVDDIARLINPA
jgi:hydrogenase expression/formation protein HypC